jgi:hypothetical protein
MNLIKRLIETAEADSQLWFKNRKMGDRAESPRDIDFVLYAKDKGRASLVANFVTDYRYGHPLIQRVKFRGTVSWRLVITIHAPATENVVMTLSAFMVCLSQLYGLEYDGWGTTIE